MEHHHYMVVTEPVTQENRLKEEEGTGDLLKQFSNFLPIILKKQRVLVGVNGPQHGICVGLHG